MMDLYFSWKPGCYLIANFYCGINDLSRVTKSTLILITDSVQLSGTKKFLIKLRDKSPRTALFRNQIKIDSS